MYRYTALTYEWSYMYVCVISGRVIGGFRIKDKEDEVSNCTRDAVLYG